jgi:uncharacterized protein (DUF1499 family)
MTDIQTPAATGGRIRTTIAIIAGALAALAIPVTSLFHFGSNPKTVTYTLLAFVVTALGILLAIILGLIGVLRRRGRPWNAYPVRGSLIALVLGVVVLVPVVGFLSVGLKYPPIHDITTDTDNPPVYVKLLEERAATHAPNSADYNPKVAEQQKKGFPNLKPLDVAAPASETFNRALEAAKAQGWRIAAAEPSEGRIEAVDVTYWSGYIDDVVIRVTSIDDTHSRIDVRSLSRVGGGDAGKNGMRIEKYLATVK